MKILDVLTSPWAIQKEKLQEISGIYASHLRGEKIDIKAIEAAAGQPFDNQPQGYEIVDGVALIPIDGVMAKKMNLFSRISGGASTELIGRDFQEALSDDDVHSIILVIDSPGGTVDGTANLSELIYNARGDKPIISFADDLMASAAYWAGSAADQVYVSSDTTAVGSIGVVSTHVDYSEQLKERGVKVTEIYAGKYKRIASEYKPLSKEGRETMQDHVDYLYSVFVGTVAKHRGVDEKTVLDNMADGRLFIGQQAVDAGLVDGVTTLDALIDKLNGGDSADLQTMAVLENELEAITMPKEIITKADVESNLPDVAEALRNEGKASVDTDAIKTDAAKAERERIQSVLDQSMPGHEALVKEMAFDGVTTGPEAAVKVLQAEKAVAGKTANDLQADAEEINDIAASTGEDTQVNANLPLDQRCKAKWDKSADLRAEFNNDFDAYVEYEKATAGGQVKVMGGKA